MAQHPASALGATIDLIGQLQQASATQLALSGPGGPSGPLEINDQTQILRQVAGTLSDIQAGVPVMVVSLVVGGAARAVEVQIGGDESFIPPGFAGPSGPKGSVVMLSAPAGPDGKPNTAPSIGTAGPTFLVGVVEDFSGDILAIRTNTGELARLEIGQQAMIQTFVPASAAELQSGRIVRARRLADRPLLTLVRILNPPALPRS